MSNFDTISQSTHGTKKITGKKASVFFQPKLTINNPADPYEQEADAMADKVMKTNNNDIAKPKFFTPSRLPVQRKCDHCEEEEKKMQRKEDNAETPVADKEFENYIDKLGTGGQPLSQETRNFYEPRLGCDFSNVRVHTDTVAAKSAQSINALAYTTGSNIVFNSGQYSSDTDSGKRLLAHELVHVTQQTGGTNNIQRTISPDYTTIRKNLTRNIVDWAVTDSEAHDALVLLKKLSPTDLRDTVAAMEKDGLVDTFFSNLTEEDTTTETEFLQQVQNYRTHSATFKDGNTKVEVSSTFSCTMEQGNIMYSSLTAAREWLTKAINRITEYLAAPGAPGMADIRDAFQMHVHTVDPVHIRILLRRLEDFNVQMFSSNNISVECAAPGDSLCKEIAAAYVHHGSPQIMRFCPSFFSSDETFRIKNVIHEAMHALFPNNAGGQLDDRAYGHERVYQFLSPQEAFDNSDSISILVRVLAQGKALTGKQMGQVQDEISDCDQSQLDLLRPAIARAARWNMNAINVLADSRTDFRQGYSALRTQHFGSDDVKKISGILKTYQEARTKFNSSLSIECETAGGACAKDTTGYYRSFIFKSGTLHVCPLFFLMTEEDRIKNFLSLSIMNSDGKSNEEADKYAAFAKAVTDKYWGAAASFPAVPAVPVIQPKLAINQPNDIYEQEADAVADKVMRMEDRHERSAREAVPGSIQRKAVDDNDHLPCRTARPTAFAELQSLEQKAIALCRGAAQKLRQFVPAHTGGKESAATHAMRDLLWRRLKLNYDRYGRCVLVPELIQKYETVASNIAGTPYTYQCTAPGSEPGGECTKQPGIAYAWTAKSIPNTELCDVFWGAGTNSQTRTIIHEFFHYSFGMGDCPTAAPDDNPTCYDLLAGELGGIATAADTHGGCCAVPAEPLPEPDIASFDAGCPSGLTLHFPIAGVGYSYGSGGHGMLETVGLDLGIPTSASGNWEFTLGGRFTMLDSLAKDHKTSYLIGIRAGAQLRSRPWRDGFVFGGFLEGGGALNVPDKAGKLTSANYLEAGVKFEKAIRLPKDRALSLFTEFAGGQVVVNDNTLRFFTASAGISIDL